MRKGTPRDGAPGAGGAEAPSPEQLISLTAAGVLLYYRTRSLLPGNAAPHDEILRLTRLLASSVPLWHLDTAGCRKLPAAQIGTVLEAIGRERTRKPREPAQPTVAVLVRDLASAERRITQAGK
jgi:hypothetical protein